MGMDWRESGIESYKEGENTTTSDFTAGPHKSFQTSKIGCFHETLCNLFKLGPNCYVGSLKPDCWDFGTKKAFWDSTISKKKSYQGSFEWIKLKILIKNQYFPLLPFISLNVTSFSTKYLIFSFFLRKRTYSLFFDPSDVICLYFLLFQR